MSVACRSRRMLGFLFATAIHGLVATGHAQDGGATIPVPTRTFGTHAPCDFYAVDVATDRAGNVHLIDPFWKTVARYAPDGRLQRKIQDPELRWPRGLAVDSRGRMYVLDPMHGTVRVYAADGTLLDVRDGFEGGESMAVDDADNLYVALGCSSHAIDDRDWSAEQPQVAVFDVDGNELLRFGERGREPGQFHRPHDVAPAPDGTIFVTETTFPRVQRFDRDRNVLLQIGTQTPGSAPGEFHAPVSVAVDSQGHLYVADRRNFRVQKFDLDGRFLLEWGTKGTGPGEFQEFHGLTVAPDDTIWVAGYHTHTVQRFDGEGRVLDYWRGHVSGPGEFSTARGVAVSGGRLYVVDGWNQRVQAFQIGNGAFAFEFGERGQGDAAVFNFPRAMTTGPSGDLYVSDDDHVRRLRPDGEFVRRYERPPGPRPGSTGLAVSADGMLFVASWAGHEIIQYDAETGELLRRFGSKGSAEGQLMQPAGIALDDRDVLYVADSGNGRVQCFTREGECLGLFGDVHERSRARPLAVAFDAKRGLVYVGDARGRIDAFDRDGVARFAWGYHRREHHSLTAVFGMAVAGDRVYVSDPVQATVVEFQVPIAGSPLRSSATEAGTTDANDANDAGSAVVCSLWQNSPHGPWRLRVDRGSTSDMAQVRVSGFPVAPVDVRPVALDDGSIEFTADGFRAELPGGEDPEPRSGVDFFAAPDSVLSVEVSSNGRPLPIHVGAGETPQLSPLCVETAALPRAQPLAASVSEPPVPRSETPGYWLWQDSADGLWHVRWTAGSDRGEFVGDIVATGPVEIVSRVDLEEDDELFADGFRVRLSAKATDGTEGFVFRVSAGTVLRFDLRRSDAPDRALWIGHYPTPLTSAVTLRTLPPTPARSPLGEPDSARNERPGYRVWRDDKGVWHVRMRSGSGHRFSGSIQASAPFERTASTGLEDEDRFREQGSLLAWRCRETDGEDGFQFVTTQEGPLRFDLQIDGEAAPTRVFIGADAWQPDGNPFVLR